MGIDYEKNHELEELLNFIRVANNTNSIRYASQMVSFILSKYEIELESIAKQIVDIFKTSSGIKKDYLAILFSEMQILELQNIDMDEIIKHSIVLLDKFKSSPNRDDIKHIDLYYRNNYITQIYIGLDSIQQNDDINKISIDKILLDESFNEFKEMCFSKNIRFLGEINSFCIIESYEKEISVRNLGNIIKDLVLDVDTQKVLERYAERKIDIKKKEKKTRVIKEQYNEQVFVDLNSKEFLCKYKDIINLDDDRVKDIFDYKYVLKDQDKNMGKEFIKELNCVFEKYLDAGNLTERQREIFKLKYNLDFKKEYTLEEIGEKYNLTRERIRQIIVQCHNKIVNHIKRSKEGQIGREFYFILFKIYKEFNSEYEKKLIITLQNKSLLILYCSILELDYNEDIKKKIKCLLEIYRKNRIEYKKNILLEKKEAEKQKLLIEKISKDVVWSNEVNILTEDIYTRIVQLRVIAEDEKSSNKGSYYSNKMSKKIQYESSIEQRYLLWLEECMSIKYYSVQPFEIKYVHEGRENLYYPDIFFVLTDGRAVVVEIKPMIEMSLERNISKYKALKAFCNRKGFGVLYTDGIESFEKYASKKINNDFEKDIINELKKGPMDWRKCEDIIFEHNVDNREINFVIMKNNLKYTQNPFCIKL